MHIEQARACRDTGNRIGIISAIAGMSTPTWSSVVAATMPARP